MLFFFFKCWSVILYNHSCLRTVSWSESVSKADIVLRIRMQQKLSDSDPATLVLTGFLCRSSRSASLAPLQSVWVPCHTATCHCDIIHSHQNLQVRLN
jgi:hypothetical protein